MGLRNENCVSRHVRHTPRHIVEEAITSEGYASFSNTFKNVPQTIVTLFSYALGQFDLEVLYNAYFDGRGHRQLHSSVVILFFVVFLFITAIILLNLLIAIMADSYDFDKQELQLLKARSYAIHDVETTMSDERATPIKYADPPCNLLVLWNSAGQHVLRVRINTEKSSQCEPCLHLPLPPKRTKRKDYFA